MPRNSTDTPSDYASLMLKAARLCGTLRAAVRCVHRMAEPEQFCMVKKAQPRIADGLRLISRMVGQAARIFR